MASLDIRRIDIYCLAIFSDKGTPRLFAYDNIDEIIKLFSLYKDSNLFPVIFSKTLYVTNGHPLFERGVPIDNDVLNCTIRIKK